MDLFYRVYVVEESPHGSEIFISLISSKVKKLSLKSHLVRYLILVFTIGSPVYLPAQEPLSPEQLLRLESVGGLNISPDGEEFIYRVSTPRGPNDPPGSGREGI
jgi:hypothetical protein